MPKKITSEQKRLYYDRIDAGFSMRSAATAAGFSLSTAQALSNGARSGQGVTVTSATTAVKVPEPVAYSALRAEAKKAWDDFAYFQQRYFGRIAIPWQIQAAEQVCALLESPQEEYVVINCPPGSGKTLLFTHDIPAWLTVRNRSIRGQMGSATGDLATKLTRRLRRSLEEVYPFKASAEDLKAGTAVDALATLAGDFGRFKPLERELWTAEAFVVVQHAGYSIGEKEATWSSYGFEQGFLGGRFDFIVWDDVVDPKKHKTQVSREQMEEYWDDLAESRLEPRGLLVLQGQRLYSTDLYKYALDKVIPDDVDPETGEVTGDVPKYQHVKYKAHYTDLCTPENHRLGAPAYLQGGCLLSPTRLSFRKLAAAKRNNRNFETVYQQEDTDPSTVLVKKEWVERCKDHTRSRLELPKDASGRVSLSGDLFSVATVDPSGSMYWAIEWWIYQADTKLWWLMDLIHQKMDAPDFLGYNTITRQHYGIADEWQKTSRAIGLPITHWVVEINAAQRYLLQYDFVRDWVALNSVHLIPHTTGRNKTDPQLGVETIAPHWEFGRIRLPFKPGAGGEKMSQLLVDEVTTYPNGRTTDLVMAEWFAHFTVPQLYRPKRVVVAQKRPSWLKNPKMFSGT